MDPIQNQNPVVAERKSFGPLIGTVLIIIALILGAFYFWKDTVSNQDANSAPVSSSDDVDSIEQDLSANSDFEADFSDIESDMQ